MASDASDQPTTTDNNGYLPLCEQCSETTTLTQNNKSLEESEPEAGANCRCQKYYDKFTDEEDSTSYHYRRCDIENENENENEDIAVLSCDEDHDENHPPIFPEGGWGWVIVLASFFNSFLFDGLGSSFGVLYPHVHEKFQASAFATSFAGSMFGAYLIMGTPAALLIKRFGFRSVSFTGGLCSCVALVLASRATNIYLFLLTYGVMGGASIGFVYLPSMVIVNGYFNKRRGITNGIISSGAGLGLLVMAPVINALLDYYSLSGTLLILAGLLLNICVFSSCFRQPKVYGGRRNGVKTGHEKEASCLLDHNEDNSEDSSEESIVDNSSRTYVVDDKIDVRNRRDEPEVTCPSLVITPCLEIEGQETQSIGNPRPRNRLDRFLFRELQSQTNHSHSAGKLNVSKVTNNSWMRSLNLLPSKNDEDKLNINERKHPCHHSTHVFTDIGANSYLAGSISRLVHVHNQHFSSARHLPTTKTSNQNSRSLSALPTHISCKSPVVYHNIVSENGAAKDKGEYLLQAEKYFPDNDELQDGRRVSVLLSRSEEANTTCSMEIISDTAGFSLNQLLRMGSFYLFCLGACLIQLGYPIPNIFLSDLAASHGIPRHKGALMISLIGSFNIGGRLLGGVLANWNLNPIQLNDIAMFFAAILCFLCPLYTSVWSLCFFSASYGFLLGFFPPLQPIIIVKYFGIGSLASTFGFVTSLKGVAGLIGPPLAGWIYDMSLDYSISIVFAGIVFLLSVVVNETLVYTTRHRAR